MADKSPFAEAVGSYYNAGWKAPLPLPRRKKKSPPSGYSGAAGVDPTVEQIREWIGSGTFERLNGSVCSIGNIALRMTPDVIGIDIDHYTEDNPETGEPVDKHGWDHFLQLQDDICGLPETIKSSSRGPNNHSGILFYKVPHGASELWTQFGDHYDIDLIKRNWRYAVVAPSIHPSGKTYEWYESKFDLKGETPIYAELEEFPSFDRIPDLPIQWVGYMNQHAAETDSAELGHGEVDSTPEGLQSWADAYLGDPNEDGPCRKVQNTLRNAEKILSTPGGSRYDTMVKQTQAIMLLAVEGHYGVASALEDLRLHYNEVVGKTRSEIAKAEEWKRSWEGEVKRAQTLSEQLDGEWLVNRHPRGECPNAPGYDAEEELDAALAGGHVYDAQQVVKHFGDEILIVDPIGQEKQGYDYVWNDKIWVADAGAKRLGGKIVETSLIRQKEAETVEDADARKALIGLARNAQKSSSVKSCIEMFSWRSDLKIDRREMNRNPWLWNHAQGTLDFRSGHVVAREFNIADLLTVASETLYDPSIPVPKEWRAFIKHATGQDPQLARLLKKACFISLTGDVSDKCFLNLFDDQIGGTGKTAFLEVIARVIGTPYVTTLNQKAFMDRGKNDMGIRSDIGSMVGKRMVMANEIDGNAQLDIPMMKKLTAGTGDYNFELKFVNSFTAPMTFTIWMDGNQKPRVGNEHAPLFDRWKLIPFTRQIENVDRRWVERMFATPGFASGVLNWILEGCVAWWADGGIGTCQQVEDAQKQALLDGDPFNDFWDECHVEFGIGDGFFVPNRVITEMMSNWWIDNARGPRAPSAQMMGKALVAKGAVKSKSATNRVYRRESVEDRFWDGLKILGAHAR